MLQVGDKVLGDKLLIVAITDNYRVFTVQSLYLGDPTTGVPFQIRFGAGETVDEINAALGVS